MSTYYTYNTVGQEIKKIHAMKTREMNLINFTEFFIF